MDDGWWIRLSVCGRVVCEQSVNVDLCWPQIKNLVKIRADEWLLVEKIINQNGSNQLNVREDKMDQGQDSSSLVVLAVDKN